MPRANAVQSLFATAASFGSGIALICIWGGTSELNGNPFGNTPAQFFIGAILGALLWLLWHAVGFVWKLCSIASMAVDNKRQSMIRERAARW